MIRSTRVTKFDWGYLIVLGLTLPVLWPLVGPAYLSSHDGLHHLFRLLDLDWCIRGGVLYPRWLPHLGFGYGYPVLNYYAPLSCCPHKLLHISGCRHIDLVRMVRLWVKRRQWGPCPQGRHMLIGHPRKATAVEAAGCPSDNRRPCGEVRIVTST